MKLDNRIIDKLITAGIEVTDVEKVYNNLDGTSESITTTIAKFPCARDFKELSITDKVDAGTYINSDFEHYRFIKDYEAIWSLKFNAIECELQPVSMTFYSRHYIMSRLRENLRLDVGDEDSESTISFTDVDNDHRILIGNASSEFALLTSCSPFGLPYERALRRLTLRIENIRVQNHDQAKSLLERIGNSLLFKLDLAVSMEHKLSPDREIRRSYLKRKRHNFDTDTSFPIYEYDNEPMSLYWYAKSAREMPLLQFLAMYQVLEFYFPLFSQKEAHHEIKNIIKDPLFNPNKDSDITKVLSVIRQNKNQGGFGSELEQLKSTLDNCVNPEEIIEYIRADNGMSDYFDSTRAKKLASKSISVKSKINDVLTDYAERIYEIRCRVVHTKASDRNYNLLLPSSPELKYLGYDIALMEMMAKKVLIATSRPLKL